MLLIDRKMPKSCIDCVCNNDDYLCNMTCDELDYDIAWTGRMTNCPLKEDERKTGKWIWHWDKFDIDTASEAECSRCKKISAMPVGYFCKWCGADMRGEEDG